MAEQVLDPLDQIQEEFSAMPDNTLELFTDPQGDDITLRTENNDKETILLNCLFVENELINQDLPDFDLYASFLKNFKRHKVSLKRQSRSEFVDVNRKDRFNQHLNQFANLNSLIEPRK